QEQRQTQQNGAARRRGIVGGAREPGRQLLSPGIAIGQQQSSERLVQRHQGDSRQQDALRRIAVAAVQHQYQRERGRGPQQRQAHQYWVARLGQQEDAQHQRNGAATAYTQELGAGHGIAGEALQQRAGQGQQYPAAARRDDARQPPFQTGGAERGLPPPAVIQLSQGQGQQHGERQHDGRPAKAGDRTAARGTRCENGHDWTRQLESA